MKKMKRNLIFCTLLFLLISGCTPTMTGATSVWIDVPVNGIHVAEGTVLPIEGHASGAAGISHVEIWINGALQFSLSELSAIDELYAFSQAWTPPAAGEYVIQAVAIGRDGSASEAANVRVQVGEVAAATPTLVNSPTPVDSPSDGGFTPTPVATAPFTPTSPPDVVIQFWADPATINAGENFTVYWHVENVQKVVFGGIEQGFDGSYSDSACENTHYTLTVTHLDGSEEKRRVDISVNGSCDPPTPVPTEVPPTPTTVPADTTPPPAPSPSNPSNGSVVACASQQTLVWTAVTDPSGIAGYYVKLEKELTVGNWQSAGGYGPISGTQVNVNIDCGLHYRWMVRAQDGAGNYSNWSSYSTFGVNLE